MIENLDNIKKNLLERKKELEVELESLYREKVSDDQVQDSGDQAWSSSTEELKISLHNAELEEYNRILQALSMIDNGMYGKCVECGQKIAEKRLLLFPNATRCLLCQEAAEQGKL